jgi:hypothetical protein
LVGHLFEPEVDVASHFGGGDAGAAADLGQVADIFYVVDVLRAGATGVIVGILGEQVLVELYADGVKEFVHDAFVFARGSHTRGRIFGTGGCWLWRRRRGWE